VIQLGLFSMLWYPMKNAGMEKTNVARKNQPKTRPRV
jgi:hypothetical protein